MTETLLKLFKPSSITIITHPSHVKKLLRHTQVFVCLGSWALVYTCGDVLIPRNASVPTSTRMNQDSPSRQKHDPSLQNITTWHKAERRKWLICLKIMIRINLTTVNELGPGHSDPRCSFSVLRRNSLWLPGYFLQGRWWALATPLLSPRGTKLELTEAWFWQEKCHLEGAQVLNIPKKLGNYIPQR